MEMRPFYIEIPDFDRAGLIREIDTDSTVCLQTTFGPTSKGERVYEPDIGYKLLLDMFPSVQQVWTDEIVPSHTFARKAFYGTEMRAHKDRDGLDYSVSINVQRDKRWDLEIYHEGVWHPYAIDDTGFGLAYEGALFEHRRKPYTGKVAYQLFLHYSKVERW